MANAEVDDLRETMERIDISEAEPKNEDSGGEDEDRLIEAQI